MLGVAGLGQIALGAVPGSGSAPVGDPPFGNRGRGVSAAIVVALWQPPDPQPHLGGHQPLAPRRLPVAITAVPHDDPPFAQRAGSQRGQLVTWWSQPDPWTYHFGGGRQAFAPRRASPAIPGQSADPPPFIARARTVPQGVVVAMAQPDPWTYSFAGALQPHAARRLSPGIPGQSIDLPPFVPRSRTRAAIGQLAAMAQPPVLTAPEHHWFAGIRQPAMGRQLSPGIPGQSVDNPSFASPALRVPQRVAVATAQPDPWTFSFAGGRQPFAPRRAAPGIPGQSVDLPPFMRQRSPPSWRRSRLWVRSYSAPISRNSAEAENECAIISTAAPASA